LTGKSLRGDTLAKKKDAEITIINRSAPRVAIQITEISIDAKTKIRRRQSIAHLTVTNLSGEQAKKIIVKAIEKAGGR
jgi:hypothetical protein